ncbi:hypothetical protein EYF80_031079 [Liparis tanakae]|uniref:Uncharacterized protein n=1 Tax=Liparis tanakae TaxID=230148 RepID=A0A4Z2GZY5_9TELE|nr:hypothetical protein EYF80_031079 [Liparis tanakae]
MKTGPLQVLLQGTCGDRSSRFLLETPSCLTGLLQVSDRAGHRDRVQGARWTPGVELLLHVNILHFLLLGDGGHLFDLFLRCSQRLNLRQKKQLPRASIPLCLQSNGSEAASVWREACTRLDYFAVDLEEIAPISTPA